MERVPLPMRLSTVPGLGRALASVPPTRRAVLAMLRQVGLRQAIDAGLLSDEAIDSYHSLLRDTDTMRNELDGAPGVLRPIRGMNPDILLTDAVLARVEAPVLLLWGDEDLFGGPATARTFAARLPAATLQLLPGAGHAPWMDDAPAVATAIARFLAA
jgi:pimeloyl-ACP methyl ester carboxylesterase